jgi:photosystem II stability/assembly factor-like uncharacterized protein
MNIFLSTTGDGLARATRLDADRWSVDRVLAGQPINCLAADPFQPGRIYAGTQGQGILFSTDQGSTWHPLGLAGQTVKSIGASRLVPGVLYAGTKPACLYTSQDQGQHWSELTSFRKIFSRRFWFSPAEAPFTAYIQGIALSPLDPKVILAGIEFGAVVRSSDGGLTWSDHRRGALRDCHSITFHPTQANWAYEAGGTGAGVAISRDGGNTWQQTKNGLDRHYGWACAADPAQPEVGYVSISPSPMKAHGSGNAQAFIFRSNRNGTWEKLSGGLPQPLDHMPYALITDPAEPGCIYAGLSNGDVWQSQDQGSNWARLPFNLTGIHQAMIAF